MNSAQDASQTVIPQPQQPKPVEQPLPQSQPIAASGVVEYASFWRRLGAGLIDGIILGVVGQILIALLGGRQNQTVATSFLPTLLAWIYMVLMVSKFGATLGKMALGIRVQTSEIGENLSIGQAILREVVGKFISGIVLALGYLWMLWDPKKQTWHDKIAKSVVVKVKK